jgi:hypothetical protein
MHMFVPVGLVNNDSKIMRKVLNLPLPDSLDV